MLIQIQLNDLDISSAHMETLIKSILSSSQIQQNFLEEDAIPVEEHMSSLLKLVPRFQGVQKASVIMLLLGLVLTHGIAQWGVEQLFNQLARPKLRSLVVEVYKDVFYLLDEDTYATAEYQDVVRKRFVKSWESLVDGFKVCCHRAGCKEAF